MSRPLLVVGDALLDVDLEGRASRLCPDAPVPVLDDVRERPRPGGAALAAALAADDGTPVVLLTPLGDDAAARNLRACLGDRVEVVPLAMTGSTPVKRRIRSGGQSVVRLDSGDGRADVEALPEAAERALRCAGAVLVSDYGRGVTASAVLRDRLEWLARSVPVVWDPHPRGEPPVEGVLLATPNAAEAAGYADRTGSAAGPEPVTAMAAQSRRAAHLVRAWRSQAVAITLGEQGALLSYGHGAPTLVPAPPVECQDPCGAGDRFAATAARTFLHGAVISEAVQTAVDSASVFVASGGAAALRFPPEGPVPDAGSDDGEFGRPDDAVAVAERVHAGHGTVVATGGCFDLLHAGHVASLRAARRLGDCLVVCLNSDASVRRLKGPSRPLVPAEDRARVLGALEFVDAVLVFDEDTPVKAIRRLRPDIWAKGGDYAADDLPEAAVLQEWGGQAVVLPYMPGRSTSSLVESAVIGRRT
ncbi:MAG: D-glycero-beta-D-manno-heptose 1-phosphate adenylyltransferase [Actinomycetota bacterium]|nr:D-glycero-beta-D-manno-heptose 1-phosphate adenylyltransferase [Actinomycetota bacterium]